MVILAAAVFLPSPANAVVVGAVVILVLTVTLTPAFRPAARAVPDGLAIRLWPSRAGGADGEPVPSRADPWANPLRVLSVAALVSFSAAGVYMILANYGLVLFTGKNVYLLGLDSLSDTLEGLVLLGMGVGASTLAGAGLPSVTRSAG